MMLNGFPSSSKVTDANVDAYLAAVDDVGVDAVQRSCKQFVSGKVEGRNNAFVPTAAELSANARAWQEAIAYVITQQELRKTERIVVYKAGEQPPPPSKPLGPIKLEIGGFMRDVSDWTHDEKEEAMSTGKVPESVTKRMDGGAANITARLRSMRDL